MPGFFKSSGALAAFALLSTASAHYKIVDDYTAPNADFFGMFNVFNETDPTHGLVQYVDLNTAISQKLVGRMPDGSIYMGVDTTNKTPQGRPSIRIESKANYKGGLLIADIEHMPDSTCGLWPAMWLLGSGEWPLNGEIDIIENVNMETDNYVTLHTSEGCKVDQKPSGGGIGNNNLPSGSMFTGSMEHTDCNINSPDQPQNVGCSIRSAPNDPSSPHSDKLPAYGTPFNANGGGIYAVEWIPSTGVSAWFFPYNGTNTSFITDSPDPKTWGAPMARFQGKGCDWENRFREMRIIFDTTFCGSWAGTPDEWTKGGCAAKTGVKTCDEWVANNPDAFKEAFWSVRTLRWFQDGDAGN